MPESELDLTEAHRYFSVRCFNAAWDLIEKQDRTSAEDRLMITLSHASLYHWFNRPDVANKNRSIGYWQLSRVYALTGAPEEARRYAELSLEFSGDLQPFHRAYAHEALARAAQALGDDRVAADNLKAALELAELVTEDRDRGLLEADLTSLDRSK